MKISACILVWNDGEILKDTMKVLEEEFGNVHAEIIIIDNGSNEETQRIIEGCRSVSRLKVRVLRNEQTVGISEGKNQCIDNSIGEYVLLLDGDVVPVRNSVLLMLDWLESHPEEYTIGMYPNRWATEMKNAETWCHQLFEPKKHSAACLFYGLYHRSLFTDKGVRMDESGPFGEIGYGWEDHDFFMQMKVKGINQNVAHINNVTGHYFHAINSSIKNEDRMGRAKYMESSRIRGDYYKQKWDKVNAA